MFRFIHSSDLHLGKRFGNFSGDLPGRLREARHASIERLARHAREQDAGTILLAGDTFDSETPAPDVRRQALAAMRDHAPIRWVILPGNHDSLQATQLWASLRAEAPENVMLAVEPRPMILSPQVVLLPAPCTTRRPGRDLSAWMDEEATAEGAVRIGLAHGAVRSFSEDGAAADVIAPDRARLAGLAYLALGDWHGHLAVGPATHYSGTPEPDDFGRTATGLVLGVELAGPAAPPRVVEHRTARYDWIAADWHISGSDDLAARLDGLAAASALAGLVVRLRIAGRVSLAERVAIRDRLDNGVAHELRWLDLDLSELQARPTEGDLAEIDLNGVLRDAAERLQAIAEEGGGQARLASAALERLYVEHQRARRRGGA